MSADDGHVRVHHQRVGKAELLNGILDLLVLFIPGFSFLRGLYSAGLSTDIGSTFNSAVFFMSYLQKTS
jgi:hypothetical protein